MYNSLQGNYFSQASRYESNPVDRPTEGHGPASAWQCYYPDALRRNADQLRAMKAELEAELSPSFREIQATIRNTVADTYVCNPRGEKQFIEEIEQAAALADLVFGVTASEFLRCAMAGLKNAEAPASVVNGVAALYFAVIRKNG